MMETIILHPKNKEQLNLFEQLANALKVPFEKNQKERSHYSPEFEAKMKESIKQAREGKTVKMNLDDIWK